MPLPVQALDFGSIDPHHRNNVIDLLEFSHGKHVRQLQLRIALGQTSADDQQVIPSDPLAISVLQAVRILEAMDHLTWLEVELLPPAPGAYVSLLPSSLASAIGQHAHTLQYFGISADDLPQPSITPQHETPPFPVIPFQLDEGMVASLVSQMTSLTSLTLHRVGKESGRDSSMLGQAISALTELRKLNLLEVQCLDERWLSRKSVDEMCSRGGLKELLLVQCDSLTLHCMDQYIHKHRASLVSLSLVATPALAARRTSSAHTRREVRTQYDLPALRRLHIEAGDGIIDSVAYIERFSSTGLEELVLEYAPGIDLQSLRRWLLDKKLTKLKKVEIGLGAFVGADEKGIEALACTLATIGVQVLQAPRSTLAASLAQ